MPRLRKGEYERRIQAVVNEVVRAGVERARLGLTARWKLSRDSWKAYLEDALKILRANDAAQLAEGRAIAMQRLDDMIADPKTPRSVRLRAIREQALILGIRAPVRQQIAVEGQLDIPAAVQQLIADPALLATRLAAQARVEDAPPEPLLGCEPVPISEPTLPPEDADACAAG